MGKQEAFEIFRRDHEDRLTIADNKTVLKQRLVGNTKTLASEGGEPNDALTPLILYMYIFRAHTDTLYKHPLNTHL